jgi:hypothetical protein
MGAVSLGFKALRINRAGMSEEYSDLAPLREIPSLAALPHLDL